MLRVHHTAGHAKHHFVVHDPAVGTVYTGDAFGLVYPALQRGARFALASTSPTDFDPAEARKSLDLIAGLGAEAACLTHWGEVRDLGEVASQVRAFVDRSEEWLDEATRKNAPPAELKDDIARSLRAAIDLHTRQRGLVLGKADWELLALDVELNAQGIAFVAEKRRAASAAKLSGELAG